MAAWRHAEMKVTRVSKGSKTTSRITVLECGKADFWLTQVSACQVPMGDCSEGPRGPGQQADLPGQPPQSSRMVHFGMQKVTGEWQKARVNGQATPASAQMLKCKEGWSRKRLYRVWRYCSSRRAGTSEGCQEKKKGMLLQVSKDKRMAKINLVSAQLCTGPSS